MVKKDSSPLVKIFNFITKSNPNVMGELTRTNHCGGERIRTSDIFADIPVFKTGPFNHSGTPPYISQPTISKETVLVYPLFKFCFPCPLFAVSV